MEKPKTEKKTTRTGRRIGMKDHCRISISANDEDRAISGMWETVKKYYSRQKITAAQTARKVLLRALLAEVEEITLAKAKAEEAEWERLQGRLFD